MRTTGQRRNPGSVIFGPPRSFFTNVGAGAPLPGLSRTFGIVNYTAIKLSKRDFLTLRPVDFIFDGRGERSGFDTTLASWTVGRTHRFSELISIRPEFCHERSLAQDVTPLDNGTKKTQTMLALMPSFDSSDPSVKTHRPWVVVQFDVR